MGTSTIGGVGGTHGSSEECAYFIKDNHKQNLRTHAGKLSSNMKKSHLMI